MGSMTYPSNSATATNILGGGAGDLVQQSAANTTSFISDVAAGAPLLSGGVGASPAYAGYNFAGTVGQVYTFPLLSGNVLMETLQNDIVGNNKNISAINTLTPTTIAGNVNFSGFPTIGPNRYLTISRSANDSSAATHVNFNRGNGSGTPAAWQTTGDGANGVASIIIQIGGNSSAFSVTSTGINSTAIGATTPSTGAFTTLSANSRINLPSFTVGTLPSAATAGGMIYVSDAGGNGPCMAVTNGTNWKRCDNTSTTVT